MFITVSNNSDIIQEGRAAIINCHTSALYASTILWKKDNRILGENNTYTISSTTSDSILKILSFGESNVGTYTCVVNDLAGIFSSRSLFLQRGCKRERDV